LPLTAGTKGEKPKKGDCKIGNFLVKKKAAELSRKISLQNPNLHSTMKPKKVSQHLVKEKVTTKYNILCHIYEIFGVLMASKARQRAIEVANIRNGEKILEVALGTGLNFVEILRRNPNGWNEGLDISPKMVKKARKRAEKTGLMNYNIRLGDSRNLPYADGVFDLIINEYMFDIFPVSEYGYVLEEFRRILKPSGRLVLVNTTKGEKWRDSLFKFLFHIYPTDFSRCRGVLMNSHLEQFHFQDIEREYIVNHTFPSEIVCSRRT
jgi:ubiquinone/menaquinone biosynthesis C-methylase UbiE